MIHNADALHRSERLIDVDAIYKTTARHLAFARMRVVIELRYEDHEQTPARAAPADKSRRHVSSFQYHLSLQVCFNF
jgi:hypothetical protein